MTVIRELLFMVCKSIEEDISLIINNVTFLSFLLSSRRKPKYPLIEVLGPLVSFTLFTHGCDLVRFKRNCYAVFSGGKRGYLNLFSLAGS